VEVLIAVLPEPQALETLKADLVSIIRSKVKLHELLALC
jgi:hypothetical protein